MDNHMQSLKDIFLQNINLIGRGSTATNSIHGNINKKLWHATQEQRTSKETILSN